VGEIILKKRTNKKGIFGTYDHIIHLALASEQLAHEDYQYGSRQKCTFMTTTCIVCTG
jgi:hypothetical protein